jgi:hypothetical protein
VDVSVMKEDRRPAFVMDQAKAIELNHVKLQRVAGMHAIVLLNVKDIKISGGGSVPDVKVPAAAHKEL